MTARSLEIPKTADEPLCTMKEAAELVGVSAQTLISYRKHGLVFPMQNGRSQLFSAKDIKWLRCLRELIHVKKFSIKALKKLFEYVPCWEIKNCPSEHLANCRRLKDDYLPCMLEVTPSKGFSRKMPTAIST